MGERRKLQKREKKLEEAIPRNGRTFIKRRIASAERHPGQATLATRGSFLILLFSVGDLSPPQLRAERRGPELGKLEGQSSYGPSGVLPFGNGPGAAELLHLYSSGGEIMDHSLHFHRHPELTVSGLGELL